MLLHLYIKERRQRLLYQPGIASCPRPPGRCYDHPMTQMDVLYRYEQHPSEATMFAMGKMREVYGVRRILMKPDWKTVQVEYDATRLNNAIIYELLRQTGLDIVEELSLIPPQPPAAEAAPAAVK
jgi:hypothetical protein